MKLKSYKKYTSISFNTALLGRGIDALQKQKYIPVNRFTTVFILLGICFVVMVAGYARATTSLQKHEYTISNLQRQISIESKVKSELEIESSIRRDLSRIFKRISLPDVERVHYIERSNASPFELLEQSE